MDIWYHKTSIKLKSYRTKFIWRNIETFTFFTLRLRRNLWLFSLNDKEIFTPIFNTSAVATLHQHPSHWLNHPETFRFQHQNVNAKFWYSYLFLYTIMKNKRYMQRITHSLHAYTSSLYSHPSGLLRSSYTLQSLSGCSLSFWIISSGAIHLHRLTPIPTWISNHLSSKVRMPPVETVKLRKWWVN